MNADANTLCLLFQGAPRAGFTVNVYVIAVKVIYILNCPVLI